MVDEQIAKAWGKLTGRRKERFPVHHHYDGGVTWIDAFLRAGIAVKIDPCHDQHLHIDLGNRQYMEWLGWDQLGPAMEAALAVCRACHDLIHANVGISVNSANRASQHSNEHGYFWSLVERIDIERFPNRTAALAAERDAIMTERPAYNVARPKPVDDCAHSRRVTLTECQACGARWRPGTHSPDCGRRID